MSRNIAGVHFPLGTEATILHAAAFSEFREHVRRLAANGDPVSAYFLWVNAVEVLHSPFQANFDIEIQGLPQLCRAPCTLSNCVRCDRQLGGFKFPWLGTWNSRGIIVPPGVQPDEAWRRYYENQEPMDLIMVNMYCGATTAKDVVPQYLYELQLRISSGQTGQLGMGEFFAAWRDWIMCFEDRSFPATFWDPRVIPRSPRGRPWPALGTVGSQAHRSLCGWLDAQKVRHYEMGTGCLARTVESEGRCGGAPMWNRPQQLQLHEQTCVHTQHVFALARLAAVLSGVAMASGKGIYAQAAQEASSSSGGDPAPGWSAADALQQVAANRAHQWRQQEGLLDDNDFAYAWLAVRSAAEEGLLAAGARVIEHSKGPATFVPIRKTISKRKGRTVSIPPKTDEATQRRIRTLVALFMGLGSFKPSGILTETVKADWKRTCTKVAKQKVEKAEKATIDRVAHTWVELKAYLEKKGRPFPPGFVDLDNFLTEGTQAPARSLQALKWVNRNADIKLDLENLLVPAVPRATGKTKGQAPVAEPVLLRILEERIEELHKVQDERWTALLGSWIMSCGCMRYMHVQRAEPRRLTLSFLHCHCQKGKQRQLREGFDFAVPSTFRTGFPWAQYVLDDYKGLSFSKQRNCGLCFNAEGQAWAIQEIQRVMQEEFASIVDNAEEMTTYSWRRVSPTLGHLLQLTPQEEAAMSDWQTKEAIPADAKMPLHYSSAKYAESLRVKATLWGATPAVEGFLTWEDIPQDALDRAKEAGRKEADRLLRQDREPIWSASQNFADVAKRLKLAKHYVEKARKTAAEASQQARPVMPDQLHNKVLTATLKNGQPLCPDWQTDECANDSSNCPFGAHLCAVLQQSGRACGGRHHAKDCRVKRFISYDKPLLPVAKPSASKVPAATGPKAVFPRKRPADEALDTDDEPPPEPKAKAKRALPKPIAKRSSAPRTPPKAPGRPKPKGSAAPKTPPKATPKSPVKAAPAAKAPAGRREEIALDRRLEWLGVGSGTAQEPTVVWESARGGKLWLSGLPMEATLAKFPAAALQVCCFPENLRNRGGTIIPGAHLMTFAAAFGSERSTQWQEVWPAMKHTLWGGDDVLVHCIKGRHRGAYLAILARAILAQESIDAADRHVSSLRNTELNKVLKDRGMANWMHKTLRETKLGAAFPVPTGYGATERSRTHVLVGDNITLCQHRQSDEKSKRLVSPMTSDNVYEAIAWGRQWCDECLRRSPASWWPPP
eukprot:s702_g55.t1